MLGKQHFPRPQTLDDVASANGLRAGVFAFPGQGSPGTLEDVLLPLAATRFPELWKHADQFVQDWLATDIANSGSDFKELRKLSGPKKARLSTMVALLKPAKPLKASIEDHRWFPDDMAVRSELNPLIEFLNKLFDSSSAERQPGT